MACREYTLPRDDPASQPTGWIQGNMRIGPVLEVTTSNMNGKHGIEIRIWSVGQEFSVLDQNISWNEQIRDQFKSKQQRNSCRSTRRRSATNKYQGCCSQIQGRKKQNHNRENLLIHQLSYRCAKDRLILRYQNKLSLRTISRRKYSVFFDTSDGFQVP